jgi:uncharacterized protein
MIVFLLIFLFLYGGLNFYAFSRAKDIFHFSGKTEFIIIVLLLFMILAPLIIRFMEKFNLEILARSTAYCCYLWMAFVFLFFFINISFDMVRYILKFFSQNTSDVQVKIIFFTLAVIFSLAFVIYGYFDAQKIRIKKLEFHTEKLLPNDGKIRIVQISDVHIGLIVRGKRLKNILDSVQRAKPDILVSTGDLLDGELNNVLSETEQFKKIKPKYGKYAITGNHEFYAGIKKALEFTKNAGFDILRDEVRQVAEINIIGIDDITGKMSYPHKNSSFLSQQLRALKNNGFVLLLKHQPYIDENESFDLQLSGHTHGGQLFPFMFFTRLFFSNNYGYYQLSKNRSIYVSKGAGTWGPPIRLLAPPEITVIDLISK